MMRQKLRNIDYSFIMAPFYLIGNDELLKSQLLNLNYQTDNSFEVIIPDPHYSKRGWLSEFSKTLQYNVVHFPYVVNPNVPKTFDYGIFNNAVLMSSTNKIITFQDWRFCHPELIKILKIMSNFSFVGFEWQILHKDDCWKSVNHSTSTIPISIEDANILYRDGIFNDLPWESTRVNTFHNSCWGHYCIDKSLWLEVNGIDEVVTNTRHYADIDLNARLEEYHLRNNKKIEIPMIKNVMVRIMHNKGNYLGGSSINFDFEVNTRHRNCCFVTDGLINGEKPINYTNDKEFMKFTINNINSGKYKKLYQVDYDANHLNNNIDNELDTDHATIGFECLKCGVISETPYWFRKSPHARIKSLIDIGAGKYKLGRDLNHLNVLMKNKTFEQKVNILNSF